MDWARASVCIGAAAIVAACSEANPREPEVRPVRTTTVEPRAIANERAAIGEIRPRQETDLAFRVSGKILERRVGVGATVVAGEVLARLDDQDYRNRLRMEMAEFAAAQAVLTEAQAAEQRTRELFVKGWTTRVKLDVAVKNLRSAEAKLEAARASLDLAKDQLAYTELHADFDGLVTAVGVEPGQVGNVGQMVVRLAPPDAKDAVFTVAETAFSGADPSERPKRVLVTLLSEAGVHAEGEIREVAPVADAATRTFQVKVALADPPPAMRFGSSVAGRLSRPSPPVVVLPGSALFDKGGHPAVWVVDTDAGVVSLRTVTAARYETDRVHVSAGLARGEVVVTTGVNMLRENQRVRLVNGGAK